MASSPRDELPDLVRDNRLEAELHQDGLLTVHTWRWSRSKRELWTRRPKPIGSGGQGLIWLEQEVDDDGKPKPTSRVRAVKQIQTQKPGMIVKECFRELEAMVKFSQARYADHFVSFFGWYEGPGSLYLAMEFCEYGDLRAYVEARGVLSEEEGKIVTRQILVALAHMHDESFAHRDLKPANILITSQPPNEWTVKLSDFGLTKRSVAGDSTTVKGTFSFLPPELLKDANRQCDPFAGDIWSAGESSYFLLTSKSLFADLPTRQQFGRNSLPLPVEYLPESTFSAESRTFYQVLMAAEPSARPSAAEALDQPWISCASDPCPPVPLHQATWPVGHEEADVGEASTAWTTVLVSPEGGMLNESHKHISREDQSLPLRPAADVDRKPISRPATCVVEPQQPSAQTHSSKRLPRENKLPALARTPDQSRARTQPEKHAQAISTKKSSKATKKTGSHLQRVSRRASTPDLGKTDNAGDLMSMILHEKPRRMWRNILMQRPTYHSETSLTTLLDLVEVQLVTQRFQHSLPDMKSLVWSLRHQSWPNSDNLNPAGRFAHLIMRCDHVVEPSPLITLDRRRYSCLFGLLMLLCRRGVHPLAQAKQQWDSYTAPKDEEEAFWWALVACPIGRCADDLCDMDDEPAGHTLHHCMLCMRYFCESHKAQRQHKCDAQGMLMDTAHFDTLLEMLRLSDLSPNCIKFVGVQGADCPERLALETSTVTAQSEHAVVQLQRASKVGLTNAGPETWTYGFPTTSVSREHADITYSAGKWYICDRGSTQGTFLNGGRLSGDGISDQHLLTNGDIIQLGVDHSGAKDSTTRAILMKVYVSEGQNQSYLPPQQPRQPDDRPAKLDQPRDPESRSLPFPHSRRGTEKQDSKGHPSSSDTKKSRHKSRPLTEVEASTKSREENTSKKAAAQAKQRPERSKPKPKAEGTARQILKRIVF